MKIKFRLKQYQIQQNKVLTDIDVLIREIIEHKRTDLSYTDIVILCNKKQFILENLNNIQTILD